MQDLSELETLINECLTETSVASREKYDSEKAERTAALFLLAQMKLSLYIEDIELQWKLSKNEIERIQAEKYFELKNNFTDKKITEAAMGNLVAKDSDVINIKNESVKNESDFKKWNYLLSSLKEGHVFFRNLSKNKTWAE
jgi:hypothetical protein